MKQDRALTIRQLIARSDYEYSREAQLPRPWQQIDLFRKHKRQCKNLVRSIDEKYATHVLDFGYQLAQSEKHWQTAVVFDGYAAESCRFQFKAIRKTHDSLDIDPSELIYSPYYSLQVSHLAVADLLRDKSLRLALEQNRGWTIEAFSNLVCFYRPGYMVDARNFLQYAAEASFVYNKIRALMISNPLFFNTPVANAFPRTSQI